MKLHRVLIDNGNCRSDDIKKKSKIEKKMIIKSNINNIECSYYSEYYI